MNTMNMIPAAAAFTYMLLRFKYVASFLYFWERICKCCVFESSSDSTVPLCNTSSMFCTYINKYTQNKTNRAQKNSDQTYHNTLNILSQVLPQQITYVIKSILNIQLKFKHLLICVIIILFRDNFYINSLPVVGY